MMRRPHRLRGPHGAAGNPAAGLVTSSSTVAAALLTRKEGTRMTADTTLTRERRKRRVLGLLAGAAGGLLLMGGTTFALWTASTTQDGGTITAGTFDLDPVGSPAYYDTSSDRADATSAGKNPITNVNAHAIATLPAYRIVPGDTLQANYKFLATLTGDNLVADVTAALPDTTGTSTAVTITAQPYYWTGTAWASAGGAVTVPLETAASVELGTFQAPSAGQADGTTDGTLPVLDSGVASGGANLVIVLTATFPNGTGGTTDVEATSVLNDLTVSINQVRNSNDS